MQALHQHFFPFMVNEQCSTYFPFFFLSIKLLQEANIFDARTSFKSIFYQPSVPIVIEIPTWVCMLTFIYHDDLKFNFDLLIQYIELSKTKTYHN